MRNNKILILLIIIVLFTGCKSQYGTIIEKRKINNNFTFRVSYETTFGNTEGYCLVSETKYNLYKEKDVIVPDYVNCYNSIDEFIERYGK